MHRSRTNKLRSLLINGVNETRTLFEEMTKTEKSTIDKILLETPIDVIAIYQQYIASEDKSKFSAVYILGIELPLSKIERITISRFNSITENALDLLTKAIGSFSNLTHVFRIEGEEEDTFFSDNDRKRFIEKFWSMVKTTKITHLKIESHPVEDFDMAKDSLKGLPGTLEELKILLRSPYSRGLPQRDVDFSSLPGLEFFRVKAVEGTVHTEDIRFLWDTIPDNVSILSISNITSKQLLEDVESNLLDRKYGINKVPNLLQDLHLYNATDIPFSAELKERSFLKRIFISSMSHKFTSLPPMLEVYSNYSRKSETDLAILSKKPIETLLVNKVTNKEVGFPKDLLSLTLKEDGWKGISMVKSLTKLEKLTLPQNFDESLDDLPSSLTALTLKKTHFTHGLSKLPENLAGLDLNLSAPVVRDEEEKIRGTSPPGYSKTLDNLPKNLEFLSLRVGDHFVHSTGKPVSLPYKELKDLTIVGPVLQFSLPEGVIKLVVRNKIGNEDFVKVKWPRAVELLSLVETDLETKVVSNWPENMKILELRECKFQDQTGYPAELQLPDSLSILNVENLKSNAVIIIAKQLSIVRLDANKFKLKGYNSENEQINLNELAFRITPGSGTELDEIQFNKGDLRDLFLTIEPINEVDVQRHHLEESIKFGLEVGGLPVIIKDDDEENFFLKSFVEEWLSMESKQIKKESFQRGAIYIPFEFKEQVGGKDLVIMYTDYSGIDSYQKDIAEQMEFIFQMIFVHRGRLAEFYYPKVVKPFYYKATLPILESHIVPVHFGIETSRARVYLLAETNHNGKKGEGVFTFNDMELTNEFNKEALIRVFGNYITSESSNKEIAYKVTSILNLELSLLSRFQRDTSSKTGYMISPHSVFFTKYEKRQIVEYENEFALPELGVLRLQIQSTHFKRELIWEFYNRIPGSVADSMPMEDYKLMQEFFTNAFVFARSTTKYKDDLQRETAKKVLFLRLSRVFSIWPSKFKDPISVYDDYALYFWLEPLQNALGFEDDVGGFVELGRLYSYDESYWSRGYQGSSVVEEEIDFVWKKLVTDFASKELEEGNFVPEWLRYLKTNLP